MKSHSIELVVLLIYLFGWDGAVFSNESPERRGDVVCGPRCVQFILRQRGIEADLVELIKEIQWPNLESGATFDQLHSALEKRGVVSELVSVPRDSAFVSPWPAIIHIPDPDGDLGHFAVLLSGKSSGEVTLWLGVGGIRHKTLPEFHRMHSGVALATRDASGGDDAVVFIRSRNLLWCSLAAIVAVTTMLLMYVEFKCDRTVRSELMSKKKLES